MSNHIKNNEHVSYGGELRHSQTGTNVPTQPTVPQMPKVKISKNGDKK